MIDIHTNVLHRLSPKRMVGCLASAIFLVGCGGGHGSDGDGSAANTNAAGGTSDICATAQSEPIKPGAQLVVVVVDRTASARTDLADPPELNGVIAEVQARGVEEKTGSQMQTLGVTASGQFPKISKPISLDLRAGDTSQNAKLIRAKILKDCVPGLLDGGNIQAKGDNTDLLGALLAAEQQKPEEIVVVSSGLNSTSQADLSVPPISPMQLAASVKQAIPAFGSWSIPVTWFNLGEPNPPLSASDRDRVIAFWQSLLGDKLDNKTRE